MTIVNASRGTSKLYVDTEDAKRTAAINAEESRAKLAEKAIEAQIWVPATDDEPAHYGTVTQAVLDDAKVYTNDQITQRVTQVYSIQGTCTHAQLNQLKNLTGDNKITINEKEYGAPVLGNIWNVTDGYGTIGSPGYVPPGTNYVWDGTDWDPMGGSIDLSTYETTAAVTTKLSEYSKTTAINGVLAQHQDLIKKTQVSLISSGFDVDGTTMPVTGVTGLSSEILIVSPIPSHIEKATTYGIYASASGSGTITFKADAAIAANDTVTFDVTIISTAAGTQIS